MISFLKSLKFKLLKICAKCIGVFTDSSLNFGPPKGYYLSVEDYLKEHNSMGKMKCLLHNPFKNLVCIKKGRICLEPWSFITSDDKILFQESNCYNSKPEDHWALKTLKLPKCTHLKGKTLMLSSRRNYWHKLTDDLSLINLLKTNDYNIDIFDNIICEKPISSAEKQIHEIGNISEEKLVPLSEFKHLESEELYLMTGNLALAKDPILQTRSTILERAKALSASPLKRIVIGRDDVNTRRWLNQYESVNLLKEKYGFVYVSTSQMNLIEQAKLFNGAEIVVGVHGAGLTNILFMNNNATVIELRYKKQIGKFSSADCYVQVSDLIGIKHFAILCEGMERKDLKGRSIEDADVIVNLTELSKVIEMCNE